MNLSGENKFAFSSHLLRFMVTIYEAVEFRPAANKSRRPIDFPNYLRAPLAKLHSRCLKFILFCLRAASFYLSIRCKAQRLGNFSRAENYRAACAQILKNDPPVSSSIKNVSLFISIKLWRRRRRNQLFANFFMAGPVYYVHTFVCAHVIICALAKSIKWRTQHFPLLFLRRPAARIFHSESSRSLWPISWEWKRLFYTYTRARAQTRLNLLHN